MEGAEAHEVRPPAGKLNVAPHHIDNAHRADDTLDVRWIYISHFATDLQLMHRSPLAAPLPTATDDGVLLRCKGTKDSVTYIHPNGVGGAPVQAPIKLVPSGYPAPFPAPRRDAPPCVNAV